MSYLLEFVSLRIGGKENESEKLLNLYVVI